MRGSAHERGALATCARRQTLVGLGALLVAGALAGTVVQRAWAVEEVRDGSFESSSCTVSSHCANSFWAQGSGQQGYSGPICVTSSGICGYFGSTPGLLGPHTGTHWVQMGGEDIAPVMYDINQVVNIPAAPATLRFYLWDRSDDCCESHLDVNIDGTRVFFEDDRDLSPYREVSVDVSSFAGGQRKLSFTFTTDLVARTGYSDSFDIDDISLDSGSPASPAAAFDLAAAVKHCKKKFPKGPRRKKCIRKANQQAAV